MHLARHGEQLATELILTRCERGAELGLGDFYTLYEFGEQQLQRYMNADMAKAGFMGLKFKSADVIFDDNTNFATTAETGYFLNTDYLYVMQHKEAQWSADEEKRPTNQYAVVIPYYWMGNLVCSQRALQGKLFDAG